MESQTKHITLPPELWDPIVDELSSDRSAVQACSLTHRAWVASTRRHLFKAIELKGTDCCRRFRDILISSSSIGTGVAQWVYDVTLSMIRLRLDVPEDAEVSDVPLLEETLSRLPNVDSLRLHAVEVECRPESQTGGGGLEAEEGYPDRPLRSLFTLPKLRLLVLKSISFRSPLDTMLLLSAFPQASSLYLVFVSHREEGPTDWPLQLQENSKRKDDHLIITIRELHVVAVTSSTKVVRLLGALKHPPFKCALQKLYWLPLSSRYDGTLLEMVGEAENTLEDLDFQYGKADSDLLGRLDLSRHSRLKSLCITSERSIDVAPDITTSYLSLSPFLVRTPTSLQVLHLPFNFLRLSPDGTPSWSFMDWPSFDEALALLHQRNPPLVVHISFHYALQQDGRLPDVVQPLACRIPSAVREGLRVRLAVGGYIAETGGIVPKEYYWL